MYKIFPKSKAVCCICGTPLGGANLKRRGDKFYCEADYERTSPKELIANAKTEQDYKELISIIRSGS